MKDITPKEYFQLRKKQGRSKGFRTVNFRADPVLDQMVREHIEHSLGTWLPTLIINHDPAFRKEWEKRNKQYGKDNNRTKDTDATTT